MTSAPGALSGVRSGPGACARRDHATSAPGAAGGAPHPFYYYYYCSSFEVYAVKDYDTYLASQDLLAKDSQ